MSKARGLADLGNVYDDGALSNRNLIINGAMQVAQRGSSVSFGAAYTLDRWRIVGGASPARVATQENNTTYSTVPHEKFLKCTNPQGQDMWTIQRIENARQFSGKTLTVSYWVWSTTGSYSATSGSWGAFQSVSSNQYNVSGWGGATVSVTTTPQYVTHTINFADISSNVHTEGDFFEWNIYHGTTNDICITGVQLEQGDTATPFEHPRSYGDELQRCQRYYQVGKFSSYSAGATGMAIVHSYIHEMRSAPTVTRTAYAASSSETGTAISGANTHSFYAFNASTHVGGWYTLDAEL